MKVEPGGEKVKTEAPNNFILLILHKINIDDMNILAITTIKYIKYICFNY
jgi:hypothetical protein